MENGTYSARAIGAALGENSKGGEQVAIEFEVFEYGRVTYYGQFTDKSVEFTLKALRTAGWRGDDLSDLSSVGGPDAPEVSLVIENEEYQGRTSLKVRWVNPAGGVSMKNPMTADKAKAFAARMRGHVLALNKSTGAIPSAPTPTGAARNGRSRAAVLPPEPPPNLDEPPF